MNRQPEREKLFASMQASILEGPGTLDVAIRTAAAANGPGVPADLAEFVKKAHAHAYRVTEEEVAALSKTRSDDQVFEAAIASAFGAARKRLDVAMAAIAAHKHGSR